MRIPITLKSPDAIHAAIADCELENTDVKNQIRKKIEKHFRYGEYLTVYYNVETDKLEL